MTASEREWLTARTLGSCLYSVVDELGSWPGFHITVSGVPRTRGALRLLLLKGDNLPVLVGWYQNRREGIVRGRLDSPTSIWTSEGVGQDEMSNVIEVIGL